MSWLHKMVPGCGNGPSGRPGKGTHCGYGFFGIVLVIAATITTELC